MREFFKRLIVTVLTWEAKAVLRRYEPRIIAITGSVGKTTTKDAVYATLAGSYHVRKSEKSFNSEIGVPLTILGCENAWSDPLRWIANILRGFLLIVMRRDYPNWLVLEVGADRPGDIRNVARWLRPDIVIITGVPEIPVHVEYFSSPEALMYEKRSLAEHVKQGGSIVLNGDNPAMVSLCSDLGAVITYGFEPGNSVRASRAEIIYERGVPKGMRFKVKDANATPIASAEKEIREIPMSVSGALGRPRVYAALAALVVAKLVGAQEEDIVTALAEWEATPGRMRIIAGKNGAILLDDTYNSSLVAALAALDTLKSMKCKGRRIALLGDMLELGKYSKEAHRNVGERAASVDILVTVGFRGRATAEAALDFGLPESNIRQYEQEEAARAAHELVNELQEGDVVLVKGSQSLRMERAVEVLMAEPEHAEEFLVRQDNEWKQR